MPEPTHLRLVIVAMENGRYSWRLETVNGHFEVISSGTAYLTRASAVAGFQRFRTSYLREDAPIEVWREQ